MDFLHCVLLEKENSSLFCVLITIEDYSSREEHPVGIQFANHCVH